MRALILNYGVGNIYSIMRALRCVGFEVHVANTVSSNYDLVVLPGVGSFKSLEHYISENGILIKDLIKSGVYVLGICLGMQILFEYSTEHGHVKGLGVLSGYVDRIPTKKRIPHIGWDRVYVLNRHDSCSIFEELHGSYVYFMHSYIVYPKKIDYVCMVSLYDVLFPAAVAEKNTIGLQFHPEKSSHAGHRFLSRLAKWMRR